MCLARRHFLPSVTRDGQYERRTSHAILARIQQIKDAGLKLITLMIGFWYERSLASGDSGFDLDVLKRSVTFFDDGNKAVNTSSWPQCGRALDALASLKKLPEDADEKFVALAHFKDRPAFLSSFRTSQHQILESVQKVTGTKYN